jgi:hypothetical protein
LLLLSGVPTGLYVPSEFQGLFGDDRFFIGGSCFVFSSLFSVASGGSSGGRSFRFGVPFFSGAFFFFLYPSCFIASRSGVDGGMHLSHGNGSILIG